MQTRPISTMAVFFCVTRIRIFVRESVKTNLDCVKFHKQRSYTIILSRKNVAERLSVHSAEARTSWPQILKTIVRCKGL